MSKPDDIPQDVWDAAVFALYGQAPDEWVRDHAVLISRCARAILAAKAEEREACALIADGDAKFHIEAAAMNLPVSPGPIIAKDRAVIAKRIAAAIRKREEP